ncbi:MAG: hypothetical protein LBS54_08170 [Dysgonamonadaceae bacterium]|jgi:hypothetical protein|nr:hypothetical protein [Dysgonamonadaceae bacterium]
MSRRDYIPRKDAEFKTWSKTFVTRLAVIMTRIGFPSAEQLLLLSLYNDFEDKFGISSDKATRTASAVDEKNKARAALEKRIRNDVEEYIQHNHLVTDTDRINLGLTVYKKTRTPSPVANDYPWMKALTHLIRHIIIEYGGSETSRAKPEGQHGIELVYLISNDAPLDISQLNLNEFDTDPPLDLEFTEEQRGTKFWFAARWKNTRAEKGPWSPIYSAVIP